MRISEIVEASSLVVRRGTGMEKSMQKQHWKPGSKRLGTGAFGSVYSEPGDVETVKKISRLQSNRWDHDGYFAFVDALRQLKPADKINPYLPQIYKVKPFETTNRKRYLEVTMEKLYPFKEIRQEEAFAILEKLTGERLAHDFIKDAKRFLLRIVERFIENPEKSSFNLPNKRVFAITDVNFKKAAALVNRFITVFNLDLHDQNIMFRRTSTGAQLVITDPLGYEKTQYYRFYEQISALYKESVWHLIESVKSDAMVFYKCDVYTDTLKQYPHLHDKIRAFMDFKEANPLSPYGSNDRSFEPAGFYGKAVKDLRKAHLSRDESLLYRIEGTNPRRCYLFGIFTHHDLGTGTPANKNRQKTMADQMARIRDRGNFASIAPGKGSQRPVQES